MGYEFEFSETDQDVDELLEQTRQERIRRGLPPDRPPVFVPTPLARVLLERVAPLREILIRYTLLVNNARKVLPIDVGELRQRFAKELALITESIGVFTSLSGYMLLRSLDQIEEAINADSREVEDLTRLLYVNFEIGSGSDLDIDNDVEAIAEYDRLKADEALFQSEIDKYSAEYESIRHLL